MKERNRIFAILLAVMMVFTYMPGLAYAEAGDETEPAVTTDSQEEPAMEEAVQTESAESDEPVDADVPSEAAETEVRSDEVALPEEDAEEVSPENTDASDKTEAPKEAVVKTLKKAPVNVKPKVKLDDSDELLMAYLENAVAEEVNDAAPAGNGKEATNSRSRINTLENDAEYALYEMLESYISYVASGEESSTEFTVSMSSLFGDKLSYTEEELGTPIIVDEQISDAAIEAFDAMFECDVERVVNALMADMPFELYWYDKTEGYLYGFDSDYTTDGESLSFDSEDPGFVVSFYVSPDYSADGSRKTMEVNTEKTSAAASFVSNTVDIINGHSADSDVEKLYAYKEAVCEATDYNDAAAATTWTKGYGDPWQLIYVFDGDTSTKVVCEGYSKAFQFLCDRTEFNNTGIEAYSVTGDMDGGTGAGAHMWNILHMDDGNNYIADVTNCDEGNIGAPDDLFLKGCTEGSVDGGYSYACGVDYSYDTDTRSSYSDEELEMSAYDYGESGDDPAEENPVKSISYTTIYSFIENKDGYYPEDEDFFWYSLYPHKGDVLTVNDIDYVYRVDDDEEGFFNADDEKIDYYSVDFIDDQWENHWIIPDGEMETTVNFIVRYNGAECEAEAKLIKNPVTGIEYTPVNEYADLIDGVDGYEDEEEGKFIYNPPGFEEGDQLKVIYRDKSPVTYIFEEDCFVNPDDGNDYIYEGSSNGLWIESDQSEQWVLGGTYNTTITYEGQETSGKKVRIVANPIKSISFSRNGKNSVELIEGIDSYLDGDWDEITDTEITYTRYEFNYELGDQITLNKADGSNAVYEYRKIKNGRYSDEFFVNVNDDSAVLSDDTDVLDEDFLYYRDDPVQSPDNEWKVGGHYKKTITYYGRSTDVNIDIIKNPVTEVKLEFADGSKKVKLIEGVSGSNDWGYDEEDNRIDYFYYNFPEYKAGDKLTVTKNGGMYSYVYRTRVFDGEYYRGAFVNVYDEKDVIFEYDDVDVYSSNQSWDAPWVKGGTGYSFELRYYGVSFEVPAEVVENPVASIDFERDGYDASHPIELTEGIDGWLNSDGGENRWFEYYLTFKNGDKIKIEDPKGNETVYNGVVFSEEDSDFRYFKNDAGEVLDPDYIDQKSDQSLENQWKAGDGTHQIDLEYYARTKSVSVKIKENPVKKIEFVRPGSDVVELTEYGDGYWDDSTFRYEIRFKAGDELYVTYAGSSAPVKYVATASGNGKAYSFDAAGSVPSGAKESIDTYEINFMHNSEYKLQVEEGEQATMMLMYQGLWTDVPVKIVESPVESFEFVWKEGGDRVELTEGKDGYISNWYSDEGDKDVFVYWLPFLEGDQLKVKYTGIANPVTYVFSSDKDSFVASGTVPAGAPAQIAMDDVEQDSDQDYYVQWAVGSDHEMLLRYMGRTFIVPVSTVAADPYDISNCEVAFDNAYRKLEQIESTPYDDYFYVVHTGTVLEPIVEKGDTTLGPNSYNARYLEQEFDKTAYGGAGAWGPKQGAEWSSTFPTKAGVYFCEVSGKSPYKGTFEGFLDLIKVEGHSMKKTEAKAATCKEAGYEAYWECTVCHKMFADEQGSKEITAPVEIPKSTAHAPVKIAAKVPTFDQDGNTEGQKCSVCGEILVAPETIPSLQKQSEGAASDAEKDANAAVAAADNSTDETKAEQAQASAAEALKLAEQAEKAAENAQNAAQKALDNLPATATAEEKAIAQANLDNATANLAVAKQIKAAASTSLAKAKTAAAKVASNKAKAASDAASKAANSAAAEELRKEAAAQAAKAEALAKEANSAAEQATEAKKEIDALVDKIQDEDAKKEASDAKKTAEADVSKASEAASAADTSAGDAKKSETSAQTAVNSKAKAEADAAKAAKAAAAAKAVEDARQGIPDGSLPKVKIKKPSAKKTSITVKWTKLNKKQLKKSKATHYEIWVSESSSYPAGATTKEKIVKKSKSSWTCKGLKKNKKYYVKIRAIKYVGGAKHVGKWKQKTIKTKKK